MSIFLISIGVMCGLAAILALVMVAAELTIGNYGVRRIKVNDEREITVEGGKPLLSSLKSEGIFIPSACGGRGSCGLCKCRVTAGAGEALATELPWLNPEERQNGTRLACQVKVREDMRIEIAPELLAVREYKTRIVSLTDLTHDIKEVVLELSEPPEMAFVAGQFVQFEVPPYELTDEPVYRAYSISSPPSDKRHVEMEIRLVPNGICTTYVHTKLRVGDAVTINGPYGEFRLSDTGREMVCIAGGSGMAPIKSILLDMEQRGISRKITYFFGARARRDLFMVDEMRRLEKTLPNFKFVPCLGSPAPGDNWDGETGLVTEVLARHVADASQMEGYLCGSPLMIDACVKVLRAKGMSETAIFYDKFA